MKKIELVKEFIKKKGKIASRDIQDEFKISRAMADRYLKQLIKDKFIRKYGKTRGAYYQWGDASHYPLMFEKRFYSSNKDEDQVFELINAYMNFTQQANKNTFEIVRYGMTEMINNVIDHSESKKYYVKVIITDYTMTITVRDYGIGIFRNIVSKMNFIEPEDAIFALMKGKVTTNPETHSGEGIFFTMKAMDRLIIRSYNDEISSEDDEITVASIRKIEGTEIQFTISRNTNKVLRKIFDKYAGEKFQYKFDRTHVYMNIGTADALVSRSKAKRIIQGMEKFKEIEIDFNGVKSIGQGFSHEIFNVFLKNHPNVKIIVSNAVTPIKAMVKHTIYDQERILFK